MFVPMLFVLWARNYASYECGSKVIAANSEAEGTPRILNEMMDEYLLNPCKAQIWFIVELCESIQPLGFELANYELFSSTPKDFTVYGSEVYPTREWVNLGSFTAHDVRTIQRFELQSQSRFFKYMKVEMKSHYGAEHYCPLSVIRFFGTSMVEEFDAIENGGNVDKNIHFTDVENLATHESSYTSSQSHSANLIGTAREAVMNMVRKAAMALSKFPSQEAESFNKSDFDNLSEQRTSDVLQLSLSSFKFMPVLDNILLSCNDCGGLIEVAGSSPLNQKLCDYIKVLLGIKTYAILCEEISKEPMLRFRCPLLSYFINTTHPLSIDIGPDELSSEILVPSYFSTKESTSDSSTNLHEEDNFTQAQDSSNQPLSQKSFIVETVLPSSVIEGSLLSSITSVLIEPNHNESENLKPSEFITDLVNNTMNTPSIDNNTQNLADQSIDSSSSSINSNGDKVSEETPTLSTPSPSISSSSSQPPIPQSQPAQAQQPVQPQQTVTSGASQPTAPTNTANWVPLSASQAKESSVFIRMSNKIKALEVNLSLSNQFLEELNQRYRKNAEEMQQIINETLVKLNETAQSAAERDEKNKEMLNDLQSRLILAEDQIALFIAEKETLHWSFIEIHIILLIIEIIIMFSIMSLCIRRASATSSSPSSSVTSQNNLMAVPSSSKIADSPTSSLSPSSSNSHFTSLPENQHHSNPSSSCLITRPASSSNLATLSANPSQASTIFNSKDFSSSPKFHNTFPRSRPEKQRQNLCDLIQNHFSHKLVS